MSLWLGRAPDWNAAGSQIFEMRVKHIPQRTCVGCRIVKPKRELVRLVRKADDQVEIDLTGKQAGRGAYLHREMECWLDAIEKHTIERALKMNGALSATDREKLEAYAKGLPMREVAPGNTVTRQSKTS